MIGSDTRIAIIGGGLAGMVAAWQLVQQGVHDLVLFEAREVLGGRIRSVDASAAQVDVAKHALDRFDLGPSWFWPELQPQLDHLVAALGLQRFAQFEDGDLLVERSAHQPPQRLRGFATAPPSMRLMGGTGAIIASLGARLPAGIVNTGQTLRRLQHTGSAIALTVQDVAGVTATWHAQKVLLGMPPRLAEARLAIDPPLPTGLARHWQATPTWMAPHAKYVAIFETPFWRAQGLSGGARSGVGPLGEVHDVSMPGGHAALFGFLGVPAQVRRGVTEAELRAHCRAQLARLFGAHAAAPLADAVKDWASDPLCATEDDQAPNAHHGTAPPSTAGSGPWQGRLFGIGSEWSPEFPGYLAGAVDAATRGVQQCLAAGIA